MTHWSQASPAELLNLLSSVLLKPVADDPYGVYGSDDDDLVTPPPRDRTDPEETDDNASAKAPEKKPPTRRAP